MPLEVLQTNKAFAIHKNYYIGISVESSFISTTITVIVSEDLKPTVSLKEDHIFPFKIKSLSHLDSSYHYR